MSRTDTRLARRVIVVGALVTSVSSALVLACSSDVRLMYEVPADATAEASLPPPSAREDDDGGDAAIVAPSLSDEPVVCDASPCVTQLTNGANYFCARMSDGTVRCWGDNTKGALGVPIADGGQAPTDGIPPVVGLTGVSQIAAARNTTCALLDDGSARCWGANDYAQLGLDPADAATENGPHPTPAPVALPGPATRLDVMASGACALLASGEVACWGFNNGVTQLLARSSLTSAMYGGPGIADRLAQLAPVRVGGGVLNSRFILTSDGQLLGWGAVSGRPSSVPTTSEPTPLPALTSVTDFAFDERHSCVLAQGEVWCWAPSASYIPFLCTGLPESTSKLPVRAPTFRTSSGGRPQRIAVGATTTCARLTDGTIQCCGDDSLGQMGTGTASDSARAFRPATAFTDYAVQVVTTEKTTCALTRSGSVQCWGSNSYGELGQGTKDNEPHPSPVTVAF